MFNDNEKFSCDHLEIILKTVERCNLNCSYCYFFQGGDESYKKNPAFISQETWEAVAEFVAKGCRDLRVKKINLNIHGGEPMLQKTRHFDEMCMHFREILDPLVELNLVMQTNGTLVNNEWITLFGKHRVSIGVSCDGPEEYHNRFRVDHKGGGSHNKVVEGIKQLNDAVTNGIIKSVGVLCVIDPSRDPKKIYHHFRNDLNVKSMDFLLPDYTHDTFQDDPIIYGNFLCELFDAWTEVDDPEISVRILERAIKHLSMSEVQFNQMRIAENRYKEFTISSNGVLGSIDVLRSSSSEWMWSQNSVKTISLSNYLQLSLFEKLKTSLSTLPLKCHTCCWKKICRGGYMINRYKKTNNFDNHTVYCEGLKRFYSHVVKYLLEHSFPLTQMQEFLCS